MYSSKILNNNYEVLSRDKDKYINLVENTKQMISATNKNKQILYKSTVIKHIAIKSYLIHFLLKF